MHSLNQLAHKYKTDKVTHGFIDVYDKEFSKFRHESFNILEIGVFFGASIKMWDEYFSKANVFGLDTFEGKQGNGKVFANPDKYYNEWMMSKNNDNSSNKIHLMKLDQSNADDLEKFVKYCNERNIKFKIIIDDGSHLMKDQQLSFFHLFELVEEGGIYVMEDIHTSDQPGYDVFEDKSNSTKSLFLNMKNGNSEFKSVYIQNNQAKCIEISSQIKDIEHFFIKKGSETLIIRK